jgi:prepilin peptidase CpaA
MPVAITALSFVFILAVIYGALSDLTRYKIPNLVSYGLVLLFIPYAALTWNTLPILMHIGIFALVFMMCIVFWQLKWMGGGDVKFMAALSLWMGPDRILIFLVLLCGLSSLFVVVLRFLIQSNDYYQAGNYPAVFKRVLQKASEKAIPYGLPSGIAALIAYLVPFSA